jgi:hypothetical protein
MNHGRRPRQHAPIPILQHLIPHIPSGRLPTAPNPQHSRGSVPPHRYILERGERLDRPRERGGVDVAVGVFGEVVQRIRDVDVGDLLEVPAGQDPVDEDSRSERAGDVEEPVAPRADQAVGEPVARRDDLAAGGTAVGYVAGAEEGARFEFLLAS